MEKPEAKNRDLLLSAESLKRTSKICIKQIRGDKQDFLKDFNEQKGPAPFETNRNHDKD